MGLSTAVIITTAAQSLDKHAPFLQVYIHMSLTPPPTHAQSQKNKGKYNKKTWKCHFSGMHLIRRKCWSFSLKEHIFVRSFHIVVPECPWCTVGRWRSQHSPHIYIGRAETHSYPLVWCHLFWGRACGADVEGVCTVWEESSVPFSTFCLVHKCCPMVSSGGTTHRWKSRVYCALIQRRRWEDAVGSTGAPGPVP